MMTKEQRDEMQLHIKHMRLAEVQTFWLGWVICGVFILIALVEYFR